MMANSILIGTFKHQKGDLRDEGMDVINKVKDPMFFLDSGKYIPLTPEVYNTIVTGKAKL